MGAPLQHLFQQPGERASERLPLPETGGEDENETRCETEESKITVSGR